MPHAAMGRRSLFKGSGSLKNHGLLDIESAGNNIVRRQLAFNTDLAVPPPESLIMGGYAPIRALMGGCAPHKIAELF